MADQSYGDEQKTLDLLKMNYQNLHDSTWECHKAYWTLTSFLLPLSFTSHNHGVNTDCRLRYAPLATGYA